MNPWSQIVFRSLPAAVRATVTPRRDVCSHFLKDGLESAVGGVARGRRQYATAPPRYILTPKVNGKTPKLVKADGAQDITNGFARFNKNQHHEQLSLPKYWECGVWFANGKPVLRKFRSHTPGIHLEALRSIVPGSALESDAAATINASSNNVVKIAEEAGTNESNSTCDEQPRFTLTEYNSWLKADRAQRRVESKPECIDLTEMPAWYKNKTTAAATTSTIALDGQSNISMRQLGLTKSAVVPEAEPATNSQQQRLEQQQQQRSAFASVPAWQWQTDFNVVLQNLRDLTNAGESGVEATMSNANNNKGREMTQIVIDFEKQRWLQLPSRTHFLRPKPVRMEASSRNFSSSPICALGGIWSSLGLTSSSSSTERCFSTRAYVRSLDEALAGILGKPKVRYFVKRSAINMKQNEVLNTSRNNNSGGVDQNNNRSDQLDKANLHDAIAMIIDPRSPTGGPRPDVVVRPPNVPTPKQFIKVNRLFLPVEDNVQVLPTAASEGEEDLHVWWKWVLGAGFLGLLLLALFVRNLITDACPIFVHKEKDDPRPMVGKYETSLPVKMKDIKKAEVVMGRPQKEHMKTWSDIEKNWNTQGPDATHLGAGAGAAPAQGDARFGAAAGRRGVGGSGANFDADDDFDEEVGPEVKLRRDVNLRRNMRLEVGRTNICQEKEKK